MINEDDKKLDIRSQFYERMSLQLSKNPDSVYVFMRIVCDVAGLSDLSLIELMYKNSKRAKEVSRN